MSATENPLTSSLPDPIESVGPWSLRLLDGRLTIWGDGVSAGGEDRSILVNGNASVALFNQFVHNMNEMCEDPSLWDAV